MGFTCHAQLAHAAQKFEIVISSFFNGYPRIAGTPRTESTLQYKLNYLFFISYACLIFIQIKKRQKKNYN